jgi:molecular chaperone DnaK
MGGAGPGGMGDMGGAGPEGDDDEYVDADFEDVDDDDE